MYIIIGVIIYVNSSYGLYPVKIKPARCPPILHLTNLTKALQNIINK